jgi:hypothetical protein
MPQGRNPTTDNQDGKAASVAERRAPPKDGLEPTVRTAVRKDEGGAKKPSGSGPSPAQQPPAPQPKSDAERREQELQPTANAGLAAQGRRGPMDDKEHMDDKEQRIREIAYFLWEQEGYPGGREGDHWAAAVAVVEAQDAERKKGQDEPQGKPLAR